MAPWTKDLGPLGKAQKEGDQLKKKVDQTMKESNKVISNKKAKDRDQKLEQMYLNCFDVKTLVQTLQDNVEQMKEDDEPAKVKDFDKKKSAELNRLSVMKVQLTELMEKLQPDTSETEFLRKHRPEQADKDQSAKKDEEDDEEEEDEEEEEDDEEDDEEEEGEEEEEEEENVKEKKAESKAQKKKDADKDEDEEEDEEEEEEDEEEEEEEEDEEEEEEEEKVKPQKAAPLKHKPKKDKGEDEDEEDEEEEEEEDEDEEDEEEEEDKEGEEKAVAKDKGKKKKEKAGKKKKGVKTDEDEDMEITQSAQKFEALEDYDKEEDGDLAFKKGEILTILQSRHDGWWTAENEAGERGLVPSTFLQVYNQYKDAQQDDEEEGEEEEEEEDEGDTSPRQRSGKKLWGGIRKALEETTVSDVLHAMGAVPSGFRLSTLCRKFNEGDTYRLSSFLMPKLSLSNLTYRDLFFDPATSKIRPRPTRIERIITLVSCQQIPPPGAGIEVLDRHVRICLFDGHNILSNIHSVKVASVDKSHRSWAFTTRVTDLMDPHKHAEVFVRSNNTSDNIGVLFELCVSYKRTSTHEMGEFSCGWVHLPFLENGAVVANKSFDLYVNGGTPYEKGIEVDPSISRRTTSNALVSLISGNKQPRLVVKVQVPKQLHKELMDTMPDTMVGNTTLLRLYSYFRQCLADTLLRDRLDLDSTELIHSAVLREFPKAADTPDLMEFLTHEWIKKLRDLKRAEKPLQFLTPNPLRDEEYMKDLFRKVFMECVYPVGHLAMLPPYRMGDTENIKLRQDRITKYAEVKRHGNSALAALLSQEIMHEPFQMEEVSYSIIGPHCLAKQLAVES